MNALEFERMLWLSSAPIFRIDDPREPPAGMASGCLIDYRGKRLLLTVSHATGDQRRWAIQLRYDSGRGTAMHGIGAMNFLARGTLPKLKLENVDFAYVEVPANLQPWRQEIEPPKNEIKAEFPISVLQPSLTDVPAAGYEYGFCGMVLLTWENHFGQKYLGAQPRIYTGLSFMKTEDDFHYFKLPFKHPGHEQFEGCSGAPVLNKEGALVGLLCGGDTDTDEVWAVSTRAYKTAIDILTSAA